MIRILDKHVSDKIAAGEVVERPLSIVKELVENSIDAGADSLVIEIKQGGKNYIRVSDNGSGIDPKEIELAFTRHGTSKISSEEDLNSIDSLGFRGEALSSIAAVSRVEIISKTLDSTYGTKVKISGGMVNSKDTVGCGEGTNIIITDLFYNTPARLKFMKSDSSESTPIIEFISHVALAYPNIKIRLINNDKMIFSTTGKEDREKIIALLYGKEVSNNLLPINYQDDRVHIEGFVSNLNQSKPNRRYQIYFVNGRVVENKTIQEAIAKAYEDKLILGRHPLVFLFLNVPPEEIDVNIHPNKLQVKFQKEAEVYNALVASVNQAQNTMAAVPKLIPKTFRPGAISFPPQVEIKKEEQTSIRDFLAKARQASNEQGLSQVKEDMEFDKGHYQEKSDAPPKEEPRIGQLSIIGSVFATYILAKDEDCLYLIDQHAAHERIFYEELMKKYGKNEVHQQLLLRPLVVNRPRTLSALSQKIIEEVLKLGFEAEEFGNNTYIVKSIPSHLGLEEAEAFLLEYLDTISPGFDFNNQVQKDQIIMKACKSAIKAKDSLEVEEIRALLVDLDKCENPFNCPHGRPIFVKLSAYDIERLFKRM
ncbi:MAG: DNA mismatch repair endonuclease MutL [Anaerovoracaceae bacterium]|jgi:DNA mismatch repair protein MutL|nr:DNA mismatch repair endonuclease MutL [Anaerovoracaceae bacterium]